VCQLRSWHVSFSKESSSISFATPRDVSEPFSWLMRIVRTVYFVIFSFVSHASSSSSSFLRVVFWLFCLCTCSCRIEVSPLGASMLTEEVEVEDEDEMMKHAARLVEGT